MKICYAADSHRYATLNTAGLREAFLVESLFQPGVVSMVYSDADRAVVGSAAPGSAPLELAAPPELRARYFTERRELGVLNVGGPGKVVVDGAAYPLDNLDCLYVGRGSRDVSFSSVDARTPAAFYLLSYPAHADYPTTPAAKARANAVELGAEETANRRTLYKYIHPDGVRSCQLVMGFTRMKPGSVWNTMPPHTHARRTEVYLYFDLPAQARVMHFMGLPEQTRHLVVADRQAVVSPSWSIHAGCGTSPYAFCWGMGGENQAFDDMDALTVGQLK